MIDSEGYREGVGIIISHRSGKLLWCRRYGQDAWQFPQGGLEPEETLQETLYRELFEETGLRAGQVEVVGRTREWLSYLIPPHLMRRRERGCIGQKQVWFLLKLIEGHVRFHNEAADPPEFDEWCWVDYWYPVDNVVDFKRGVYRQALTELEPLWARHIVAAAS